MKKWIKKHEKLWILMTSLRGSTSCGVGQNMKKHENTWRKHKNVNIFYPEFLIGNRNNMKKCIRKHKKHEELWIVVTSLRGWGNCGVEQNMKKTWKFMKKAWEWQTGYQLGSMRKACKKHDFGNLAKWAYLLCSLRKTCKKHDFSA